MIIILFYSFMLYKNSVYDTFIHYWKWQEDRKRRNSKVYHKFPHRNLIYIPITINFIQLYLYSVKEADITRWRIIQCHSEQQDDRGWWPWEFLPHCTALHAMALNHTGRNRRRRVLSYLFPLVLEQFHLIYATNANGVRDWGEKIEILWVCTGK